VVIEDGWVSRIFTMRDPPTLGGLGEEAERTR